MASDETMVPRITAFLESKYGVAALFLLLILSRFLFLDADPSFVKRVSDISDEAIWGLDARAIALFDSWPLGEVHFGLDSAPLHTLMMVGVFKLRGTSLFSLRFLAALSGVITGVVLFFFLRKIHSKRMAVLGLLFYTLGEAPFIYNRIGHIESTLTLFLLLVMISWYYGTRWKGWHAVSGILYAAAVLVKFTALFFLPALVLYWLYEWKKESLTLTQGAARLFPFVLGGLIPTIWYFVGFLIPNWPYLAKSMLLHGDNNFWGTTFLMNGLRVLGNNLFGIPTIVILLLLLLMYGLWKVHTLEAFTFSQLVASLTPLEAMAISWIFGGTLGVLFSDVSDRRFTIMFVPAIMLVSFMLVHWKTVSWKELISNLSKPEFLSGWGARTSWYALVLLPVFSLPFFTLRTIAKDSGLFHRVGLGIALGYFAFILFSSVVDGRIREPMLRRNWFTFFMIQAMFFLLFDPLTILVRHWSRHGAIVFSLVSSERTIVAAGIMVVFLLLAAGFIWIWRWKEPFLIVNSHLFFIVALYFLISSLVIGNVLLSPQFSTEDAIQELKAVVEPRDVVLGEVPELLWGTELQYIYYFPYHKNFAELNQEVWSYNPQYFVYAKVFDGQPDFPPDHRRLYQDIQTTHELQLVKEVPLYRYPLTDAYKVQLQVYKIVGEK